MRHQAMLVVGGAAIIAACDGFKEAMTAHVDVVARAGAQELSVTRLADLLGNSKVPLRRDVAKAIADLWVNYQLLGLSGAHADSMSQTAAIDNAMWSTIANARAKKWYDIVSKTWANSGNTNAAEQAYAQGDVLAARHILIAVPQQGISQKMADSLQKRAEFIRSQVTPANFASMASKYTMDPGSKEKGGLYAGFPKGQMVPEFDKALLALKPGQISPLVRTAFGWHIIYRPTFAEVKDEITAASGDVAQQKAESTYLAKLEAAGHVQLKSNAVSVTRQVAVDVDGHKDDKTVIATSSAGDFTAGKLAQWIGAFPPQAQVAQQLSQAPDSVVPMFLKNVIRNELVLHQADSAKVQLDATEMSQIRSAFSNMVTGTWNALGVSPTQLADSARTPAERERLAATRIEEYLDHLLMQDARFVDIPKPLETALRTKYDGKVNDAGLDRALERAAKVRATADSTRQATQPQSAVPMPQMGVPTPGGMQPLPANPNRPPATKRP